jgi:sugar phosphate isomerase/epimerase
MKLSIVSSLNETRNPINKISEEFENLCKLLAEFNYDGVELSILEPKRIDIELIQQILNKYDLEVSAIGTGGAYIRYGYSLGHHESEIRNRAINRVKKYIDLARELKSKVIIGLIRGRYSYKNTPKNEKLNIYSSLKMCSNIAEHSDVELLFEPINRFEIDSYNTIAESIELISKIKSKKLKLLIDTFHIYLEEDPGIIWDYLGRISHLVGHIHLADTTRRAPGSGHFDFKSFLNIFKKNGYKDYISIETIMKPSFEEVARNSAEFLQFIL